MGTILSMPYNGVRNFLGISVDVLSDTQLNTISFVPIAEAVMTKVLAAQAGNGVPSVTAIMATPTPTAPAVASDKTFLQAATEAYLAYLFTPSATNAVNTSETYQTGDTSQTIDLGGIGSQWIQQGEKYLEKVGFYLSFITGWQDSTISYLGLSGPTSSGAGSDTLSGLLLDNADWQAVRGRVSILYGY